MIFRDFVNLVKFQKYNEFTLLKKMRMNLQQQFIFQDIVT